MVKAATRIDQLLAASATLEGHRKPWLYVLSRVIERRAMDRPDHFFNASAVKSNSALVAGSSGRPRSALILLCVVSLAPNTLTETPASFRALPRRCACALVSGCSATCRIRKGGIPLLLATCVTGEKSRCFAGSLPNFSRWPTFAWGRPC